MQRTASAGQVRARLKPLPTASNLKFNSFVRFSLLFGPSALLSSLFSLLQLHSDIFFSQSWKLGGLSKSMRLQNSALSDVMAQMRRPPQRTSNSSFSYLFREGHSSVGDPKTLTTLVRMCQTSPLIRASWLEFPSEEGSSHNIDPTTLQNSQHVTLNT